MEISIPDIAKVETKLKYWARQLHDMSGRNRLLFWKSTKSSSAKCKKGKKRYGGIVDMDELKENLAAHAIPQEIFSSLSDNYDTFLFERRKLMAAKLKTYFDML